MMNGCVGGCAMQWVHAWAHSQLHVCLAGCVHGRRGRNRTGEPGDAGQADRADLIVLVATVVDDQIEAPAALGHPALQRRLVPLVAHEGVDPRQAEPIGAVPGLRGARGRYIGAACQTDRTGIVPMVAAAEMEIPRWKGMGSAGTGLVHALLDVLRLPQVGSRQ